MLIIGDDNCKVRYHLTGFPGSSHDNRVWKWSRVYRERSTYFSPLQYLIMDTAVEPCECVVPCIKKESGRISNVDIIFNQIIAKPRVRSEHLNGILKSRFPGIMRKIRKIITDDKVATREILECIDCAVILHNILIQL